MPSPQVNLGRFGQTVAGVSVVGNTEISPPPSGTTIQVDAAPAGAGVLVNGSGTALNQVTDTTQPIVRVFDGVETLDLTLSSHVGILRTLGAHDINIQTNSTTRMNINGTTGVVTFIDGVTFDGGITSDGAIKIVGSGATNNAELDITNTDTSGGQWRIGDAIGAASGTFCIYDTLHTALRLTLSGAGNVIINGAASGYSATISPSGDTAALQIAGSSGQRGGIDLVSAGYNALSILQDNTGASHFNNRQNSSMDFSTNGAVRQLIAAAGNVTINAPSSGTALTATSNASSPAIIAAATSGGLEALQLTNSSSDVRLGMYSAGTEYGIIQASTNTFNFSAQGVSTVLDLSVNHGTALQITPAGAVTINAPGSGTGLTIAGGGLSVTGTSALGALTATTGTFTGLLQAQLGLTVTGGTTTTAALSASTINASGLITGTAGATISGGTTTTAALSATTINASGLITGTAGATISGGTTTTAALSSTTGTFSGLVSAQLGLTVTGAATSLTATTVSGNLAVNSGGAGGSAQFVAPAATQSGIEIGQSGQTTWLIREPASSNDLRIWNGSDVITMTSTGNVTVAAPASGNAFTANGVSGGWASQIIAAGSGTELGLDILGGTLGTDVSFQVENHAGSIRSIRVFGDGTGYVGANATNNLSWNAAGNWIMAAPTSGIGLAVSAVANAYGVTIAAPSTLNQSYGLKITAGTSSSDDALLVQSQSTVKTFLSLSGDGSGGIGPGLQFNAAGDYTINAPGSGTTLTVNGLANTSTMAINAGTNTAGANYALSVNDVSSNTGFSFGLFVRAGTNNSDTCFQVNNAANSQQMRLVGDGSGSVGPYPNVIQWNSSGAFSLNSSATFGANSKAQNGYEISPNGILRCWGKSTVTTGTPLSISFSHSFSTLYSLNCTLDSPASGSNVVFTTGIGGSSFTANVQSGAGTNNVFWHATGLP